MLIVFDVLDESMGYELLPVYNSRETEEEMQNTMIVVAKPDEEGEYVAQTLRLGLDQLKRMMEEGAFSHLLFRNGDGEGYLRLEEMFYGDIAKLCVLMLVTQEEEIDPASLNFDAMVETMLADEQLANLQLEIRVEPVVLMNELNAWETTAWLCRDELRVEISGLVPSFTVGMNVNGLFEEGEEEAFMKSHALALVDMEAQAEGGKSQVKQLESTLECMPEKLEDGGNDTCQHYDVSMPTAADPEVLVKYSGNEKIEPYRNYVMSAPYSGAGVYLVVSTGSNG